MYQKSIVFITSFISFRDLKIKTIVADTFFDMKILYRFVRWDFENSLYRLPLQDIKHAYFCSLLLVDKNQTSLLLNSSKLSRCMAFSLFSVSGNG